MSSNAKSFTKMENFEFLQFLGKLWKSKALHYVFECSYKIVNNFKYIYIMYETYRFFAKNRNNMVVF